MKTDSKYSIFEIFIWMPIREKAELSFVYTTWKNESLEFCSGFLSMSWTPRYLRIVESVRSRQVAGRLRAWYAGKFFTTSS